MNKNDNKKISFLISVFPFSFYSILMVMSPPISDYGDYSDY